MVYNRILTYIYLLAFLDQYKWAEKHGCSGLFVAEVSLDCGVKNSFT